MSRKTFTKLALLAGCSALLIAAAPMADLNGDKIVTQAEFTAAAVARFDAADTDFNGLLTKEEHKAMRSAERDARAAKHFARMDGNGDGFISEAEMQASRDARKAKGEERRAKRLAKLDTNGDGEVSEAERAVKKAERSERRTERRAERGAEAGSERKRGPKGKRGKMRPKLDTNADGMISKAEYLAVSETMFARMDANGDGQLTKGEGRKGKKRKGRKGPKGGGR